MLWVTLSIMRTDVRFVKPLSASPSPRPSPVKGEGALKPLTCVITYIRVTDGVST